MQAVGKAATFQRYGTTVAAQPEQLDTEREHLAALEARQTVLVGGIDKLVAAVGSLTNRPVSVEIHGKTIASAVIREKEFEGMIDELGNLIKYGRRGH